MFRLSGKRPLRRPSPCGRIVVEGVQSLLWDGLIIAYVDLDEENKQESVIAENSALMHGISFRTFETEEEEEEEEEAKQWLEAFASSCQL